MTAGENSSASPESQASAIPYRRIDDDLEFCLITSTSGRWVFPKGGIDNGETLAEAALKEAFEEAGLHGRVVVDSLGSYMGSKYGRPYKIQAVLMEVTDCDEIWEESHFRTRRWVSAEEARDLINECDMRDTFDQGISWLEASK